MQEKPHSREGQAENRWVLLDYLDVVVHVFQKDIRDFYEIEDIWHDGVMTNYEDLA
jgi:ribosome-associated protein